MINVLLTESLACSFILGQMKFGGRASSPTYVQSKSPGMDILSSGGGIMADICCLYSFLQYILNIRYWLSSGEVSGNKTGSLPLEEGVIAEDKALVLVIMIALQPGLGSHAVPCLLSEPRQQCRLPFFSVGIISAC